MIHSRWEACSQFDLLEITFDERRELACVLKKNSTSHSLRSILVIHFPVIVHNISKPVKQAVCHNSTMLGVEVEAVLGVRKGC